MRVTRYNSDGDEEDEWVLGLKGGGDDDYVQHDGEDEGDG